MKTNFFLAAGMLIAAIATGQNKELTAIDVTPPVFKSESPKSINDFLQKNVEYPAEAYLWKQQGTEVVQFVITPEGKITDFTVINSVSKEIDKEIIRVLQLTSGSWEPGTINGEPVSMESEVSMVFMLHQNVDFVEMAKENMRKGNEMLFLKDQPKKALRYFDWALNYLPGDETIHAIRGLCKYRLGDENGANRDWDRANLLAERNGKYIDFENMAMKSNNFEDFQRLLLSVEK